MKTLGYIAMTGLAGLASAWFLMISVEIIHARWIAALPTVGFTTCILLAGVGVARIFVYQLGMAIVKADKA